jgi:hypothetical protein
MEPLVARRSKQDRRSTVAAPSIGCTFSPLNQAAVDARTLRIIDADLAKAQNVLPCDPLVLPPNLLDVLPDTPTDTEVTLRGTWQADPRTGACTAMYCETCGLWEFCGLKHKLSCRESACCNRCGGFMALRPAEAISHRWRSWFRECARSERCRSERRRCSWSNASHVRSSAQPTSTGAGGHPLLISSPSRVPPRRPRQLRCLRAVASVSRARVADPLRPVNATSGGGTARVSIRDERSREPTLPSLCHDGVPERLGQSSAPCGRRATL